MAPEEFTRGAVIDERTTVFNLGRTLLRLDQVARAVPPLRRCLQTLPQDLAPLIRTAG